MIPQWFQSPIFCAGLPSENDGPCHGDSGGPLVKFDGNDNPRYIQLGKFQQCLLKMKIASIRHCYAT